MVNIRRKNETKRKQILEAATELFTEQGFSSTSMLLIAARAGVSKQTVYSHFGNKEQLFSASIEQKCDALLKIDVMTIDVKNIKQELFNIAKRFVDMILSKESLAVHQICAFESKTYPQLSALFYRAGPERLTDEIAKLMSRLDKEKVLKIADSRFAAVQFLHIMRGEAWMRAEFNVGSQLSESDINHYIDVSIDFFLKGYAV